MVNYVSFSPLIDPSPEPASAKGNLEKSKAKLVKRNPEISQGKESQSCNAGKICCSAVESANLPGSSGVKIETVATKVQKEKPEDTCLVITEPYACESSSLPQSHPNKEIVAKLKDEEARRTGFFSLPEGSIFSIFSLSSPRYVCRSSLVSKAFQLVADSDSVWEGFLPSDYKEILSKSSCQVPFSSKKELYFRLCNSIPIDNGRKIFSLDRSTGNKCYILSARELKISWIHDRRYWSWTSLSESRFSQVAKLQEVWFLYIDGKINTRLLSPRTTYAAYLILRYEDNWVGLDVSPADAAVEVGNHVSSGKVLLYEDAELMKLWSPVQIPRKRDDGWREIELGDFFNHGGDDDVEVKMHLNETDVAYPKGGLIIEGIEVRPKK